MSIPNRIEFLREAAGLNQTELASQIAKAFGIVCRQQTISKLESGEMALTAEWMQRLSHVLGVMPADLLHNAAMAQLRDDVEIDRSYQDVAPMLASRGISFYAVKTNALEKTWVKQGAKIPVETAPADISALSSGDIVLVNIGLVDEDERFKMLFQYVAPSLLVTNRRGNNIPINLEDDVFSIEIIGRVIPPRG
jgi:transcriptional regulator with XRE-family HTH domain